MTLTLDLPPHLANQVWATAQAQGRPVADVVCDAVADWYEDADEFYPEDKDMVDLPPLPPSLIQSLADDMREARADVDAGRLIPGHIALAELRHYVGRE